MNLIILGLILGAIVAVIGGALIWHGKLHILNPIRAFAVLVVAVISGYVMVIGWRQLDILASPDWCARSISAESASPGKTLDGLKACLKLMESQINAIAIDSHISQGVIAFCLLALIVIVIAGGKLNFKADKTGVSGSIGKEQELLEAKAEGAAQAAGAATEEADDIAAAVPPAPQRPDGMPKPREGLKPKFTPPPDGEEPL